MPILDAPLGKTNSYYLDTDSELPKFGISFTNPASPANTYVRDHDAGFFTARNIGWLSFGFTDMVDQFSIASSVGYTGPFGTFDSGMTAVKDGMTASYTAYFGGYPPLSGMNVGAIYPTCVDDGSALYATGHGGLLNGDVATIIGRSACQSKMLKFALNGSTGDQAVTGIGFEPDALVFLGCTDFDTSTSGSAGPGSQPGTIMMLGAADASLNQWVGCQRSEYNSTANRWSNWWDDNCIAHIGAPTYGGPTTVDQLASLVSMDSDGFTINLSAAGHDSNGLSMYVWVLAIRVAPGYGGAITVGNGVQGDTSLSCGYEPDSIMFATTQIVTPGTESTDCYMNVGMCDASIERSFWDGTVTNNNQAWAYSSDQSSIYMSDWGTGPSVPPTGPLAEANAAITSDGADLTWTTDDGAGRAFGWMTFLVPALGITPVPVTDPATSITTTSATLNGTITPDSPVGTPVDWFFEWGLTTGYGDETPGGSEDGSSPIAEADTISGLSPGTTYHYRMVALFGCFYIYGDDMEFTTLGGSPFAPHFYRHFP